MASFPLSLWRALQKDFEVSGLTREALADACGVPYHIAARWIRLVAPDDGDLKPETPIPADKLILAIKEMKQDKTIQLICEQLNGFFTLHPHIDLQDGLSVFEQLDNLHAKTVALSETLRQAWGDKKITKNELTAIIRAVVENQAANQEALEWAQTMQEATQRG